MSFPYFSRTATVITTTAAFSANQVIGTGIQLIGAMPQGGFIQNVIVNVNSTNASQVDFCPYTSSMPNTTFTDHSSVAISSADFAAQGPVVSVTTWNYSGVNASNGVAAGLGSAYYIGSGNLFFSLVARGALTVNSTNGIAVTVTIAS